MSEMHIQSHKGTYTVQFLDNAFTHLKGTIDPGNHYVIDKKVADIYKEQLSGILASPSVLLIEATESNKRLDKFTGYIERLVEKGIRRNHTLIAIGGGIIQDIVCFLATTLLRGVPWYFYPTTLLAQSDSCIGSKSSINVGKIKNILGTFTPPDKIFIDTKVLKTLEPHDICSGIGEMLKVHGIDGPESFFIISRDYRKMKADFSVMEKYIRASLLIKKELIEADEFDKGPRNIMNYGHSFGHAIESASEFAIPHGIAVTMGLDMAAYMAWKMGISTRAVFEDNHPVLAENYKGYNKIPIPHAQFFGAIGKDKKNLGDQLKLILPDKEGRVFIDLYPNNDTFKTHCITFLENELKNEIH